jgi:hypothetical protein
VVAAQPSNQFSEPLDCHDHHFPVRKELATEAAAINAAPTKHSQNAGGNATTIKRLIAATETSHTWTP